MKVDNAIILAAGTASRFAPLSFEKPKALIKVRGEVLIERQIMQLREAGINEIILVTGYMKEKFEYLSEKYNLTLVHNEDYSVRNNHSSIYAARHFLRNSFICSSDNYFVYNPFETEVSDSYYSAVYEEGKTNEWCIEEIDGLIRNVTVGGENSWVMMGHVFWSEEFSKQFLSILEREYGDPNTIDKLWETIFIEHIHELKMHIRKYPSDYIFEFDTLDELRRFDTSYIENSRSVILQKIAANLRIDEKCIKNIIAFRGPDNSAAGFTFDADHKYRYTYNTEKLEECK